MPDSDFVRMIRTNLDGSGEPFGLTTTVTVVDEAAGDELEDILRKLVPPSRMDPGNLTYDANRDVVDRTRFVFYDRWESLEAIAAHEQSAHFQGSIARMNELFATPPTIILFGFVG